MRISTRILTSLVIFLLLLLPLTGSAEGIKDFGDARWIGATNDVNDVQGARSIWLRKSFSCPKPIKKATLNICGLGFYEVYVNYHKVGDDLMSPAWSNYNKTVFYNTIDLTDQLNYKHDRNAIVSGVTNVLDKFRTDSSMQVVTASRNLSTTKEMANLVYVMLGNSFYNETGQRYHKLKTHFGPETLLFHLEIEYNDGTKDVIDSNDSWFVQFSPVVYNSIFGGEDYDARLESPTASQEAGISVNAWHPAVLQDAPKGVLRRQLSCPVKIVDTYPVAKRISENVFDMGQNVAGFPQIIVTGQRGQTIKIKVGEQLVGGHVSQKQTGGPHTYMYILRGNGKSPFTDAVALENNTKRRETYHPHFSYYGFRYIEIEGAVMKGEANPNNLPVIEDLQSCMVANSAAKTGSFECSNPLFNTTYQIIDRAIRSNWQSVWTDCPHREKLGWLEQDWLNGPGLVYNYDCRKMIEQTMINIADAQHDDGSMPEIAPEFIKFEGSWAKPFQESPEWGGALIALPYLYQDFYGTDSLVKAYMPQMKKYVEYLATQDSAYILKMGLGDWYDYGEGKAGFSKNTSVPLVSTAHYYRWAKQIGMNDLAENIKQAFIKEFKLESQAALAIALELGLYPAGKKDELLKSLIADIHAHGDRLTTGDVGTGYLFKVLLDNGEYNLFYKMLNHHGTPGYGYQIVEGMTTLAEQWDPKQGASRNHFMMAHINNHLVQSIVGINIHGADVKICPQIPDGLTYAKGTSRNVQGEVKVGWKINNGKFSLEVTAPDANKVKVNSEVVNKFCKRRGLQATCTVNGQKREL